MHSYNQFVVYTKHKGFAHIAAAEKAHLVPVVVFGELDSLRNFLAMPKMQAWTYKRFGFPFPFLMAGRLGFLPLPAQTGIKFVIGKPLQPPKSGDGAVYHKMFYDAVEDIWHRHKDSFPGYENVQFVRA